MPNVVHKMLEYLVNNDQRDDLALLFGSGSKFVVESILYSTQNKAFVVHCKIYVTEINESVDVFPHGLTILVEEAWKYIGYKEDVTLVATIDVA